MLLKHLKLAAVLTAAVAVSGIGIGDSARQADPMQASIRRDVATANLWVDANGGRCTRSGSAVAYRDSTACASIDAAWDACKPGDRITIRAGVYGAQTITGDKTAPGCTVRGESRTTIGDLVTNGAFFTLDNVTIDVGSAKQEGWKDRASNVTLRNVRLHGRFVTVDIYRVSNVRWLGGELGTAGQIGGARVCGEDAQPVQIGETDHITISGVSFHPQDADLTPSSCSYNGQHLEMVRLDGGTTFFTLRNSTFDNGDHSNTASVFITQPGGDADPHDLTFQNNFFGKNDAVDGTFTVHTNVTRCVNFTFAYNTFLTVPGAFECTSAVNVKWIGNLGPLPPGPTCFGIDIDNVWQDTSRDNCGRDKWVYGPRGQTNKLGLGGADGFHLLPGSPAIDAGEAAGYCISLLRAVDHDGAPRQRGIRCDAGAAEYEHGPAVVASVGRTHWSNGRTRLFTLALRIKEAVSANISLDRSGRSLSRATYSRLPVGIRRVTLAVGGGVPPGNAQLQVVFKDVAGNTRVVHRAVQIPR